MNGALAQHGLVPLAEVSADLAGCARGIPCRNRDGSIRAFTMVDPDEHEKLAGYYWSVNRHGYVRRRPANAEGRQYILLHREIVGLEDGEPLDVDHVNRNKLDNRKSNLRRCTRAQNMQNTASRPNSSSSYRGVSYDPTRDRWKAQGTLNYKNHFIGRYRTEEEAAEAARAWRTVHMPFAND